MLVAKENLGDIFLLVFVPKELFYDIFGLSVAPWLRWFAVSLRVWLPLGLFAQAPQEITVVADVQGLGTYGDVFLR